MNIFDLAMNYIQCIPDGENNLEYNCYISLIKFTDGQVFGVKYRGYDGLMSKPRKYKNRIRNKLGYFDFYIDVSGRYGDKQVTHRELIIDLLRNSKLQNCMRVWNGENIECITSNLEEQKVLYVLALCMIEQDINWGPQEWQTNSNFNFRPRDMLIGFIRIAFYFNDIDKIPYWNSNNSTPTFGRGGYARFPKDLKENFENFNGYNPISVMSGEILTLCRRKVLNKENNPYV